MQPHNPWYQNRIVIAVLGALLIGGTGAGIAMQMAQHPASAASVNGGSTPSASTATPTNVPVTSAVTMQGTIISLDPRNNTFQLQQNSGVITLVVVNGATQFGGVLGFFSDLQTNMNVQVLGTQQADGSVIATTITAQDN